MERDVRFMKSIMSDMNSNLPAERRTLTDYLENGNLFYRNRAGDTFGINLSELEDLASFCTEQEKFVLRIPLIISTDVSGDRGAWKTEGAAETSVLSKITGKKVYGKNILRLYHPDLAELRRRFPTATVIAFVP